MDKPIHIAIVGRPNVGKSTLFNRFVGKRLSVTADKPGTTRDRLYSRAEFNNKEVFLIDTGGILFEKAGSIDALVDSEVLKALMQADIVLFVCDIDGVGELDMLLAQELRYRNKQVIMVVNKVDEVTQPTLTDFYQLGFGDPFCVSAMHGKNLSDLVDRIDELLPEECAIPDDLYDFRLTIVGEPNSGKSTLLNMVLEDDRAVVSHVAGTTRDSIEESIAYGNHVIRLVDTAGIQKKIKLKEAAAIFSLSRAQDSIKSSDLILLMVDAEKGPRKDTRQIYATVQEEHKACLIVINKWDLVKGVEMHTYRQNFFDECGFMHNTPLLFLSAKTGRNVNATLDEAISLWRKQTISIPTKEVNAFLEAVQRKRRVPLIFKLKYMVQVETNPPTFIIFCKNKKHLTTSYRAFVYNQLIKTFNLFGVFPRVLYKEEKKEQ